ncbi:hemin uptake protein HemP [Paraburkholderia acidisoli]|uniref:Hemin uptake protein HemP n=1 Tax=Paraburkholderia acidisoli TaxID=2571748 RepID=A0A7Z2GHB9_9BURK|nr:hemin uptake protein HemP [Paraburkholderia acidisoli]QGZ61833.1 hemin uptake protein HemP [Paraburkholderia acidisoli]
MTDLNRTSTLSLRRSGAALTSARAKPVAPAQARKSADPAAAEGAQSGTKGGAANAPGERSLESTALLQGRSHVSILHNGETYQLRATRLGKLILTK